MEVVKICYRRFRNAGLRSEGPPPSVCKSAGGLNNPAPAMNPPTCYTRLMKSEFKGNKQTLPSKPCAVCGRPMTWRKAWARNWEAVKYCSDACRSNKGATTTPDRHD